MILPVATSASVTMDSPMCRLRTDVLMWMSAGKELVVGASVTIPLAASDVVVLLVLTCLQMDVPVLIMMNAVKQACVQMVSAQIWMDLLNVYAMMDIFYLHQALLV